MTSINHYQQIIIALHFFKFYALKERGTEGEEGRDEIINKPGGAIKN